MFGIGMPEMILILAVALIVIGPKKLPDLAKSLGRALGEFKKATSELKDSFQIDEELKSVKTSVDELNRDWDRNRPASPGRNDADTPGDADADTAGDSHVPPDRDPVDAVGAVFNRGDDATDSDAFRPDGAEKSADDAPDAEAEPHKA